LLSRPHSNTMAVLGRKAACALLAETEGSQPPTDVARQVAKSRLPPVSRAAQLALALASAWVQAREEPPGCAFAEACNVAQASATEPLDVVAVVHGAWAFVAGRASCSANRAAT